MIFFAFGITAAIGFSSTLSFCCLVCPTGMTVLPMSAPRWTLTRLIAAASMRIFSRDEGAERLTSGRRYQAETNQIADPKWRRAHQAGWIFPRPHSRVGKGLSTKRRKSQRSSGNIRLETQHETLHTSTPHCVWNV